MKEAIDKLFIRLAAAKTEVAKIDGAIRALQDVCEHSWQPNGHDSHYSYEKCAVCRLEQQA